MNKKTLIISQNSLSLHANNGKTLNNIFSSLKDDEVFQIYFQDEIPESERFKFFFRVRDLDIVKGFLKPKDYNFLIKPHIQVDTHLQGYSENLIKIRNFFKKFNFLKKAVREFLYLNDWVYWKKLERNLIDFKPNMIFLVISEYGFPIRLALKLKKKFNIPLTIYFMDDYIFCDKGFCDRILDFNKKSLINHSIKSADFRFCIGKEMANFYQEKFGDQFDYIMNSVDTNLIDFRAIDYSLQKKKYKILYAGGLTLGRFESLLRLNKIFKIFFKERNFDFEFILCSGSDLTKNQINKLESANINFLGRLNSNELTRLYSDIDFVIHIESNNSKYVNSTRYSVSTKIPECLSSKRILIAFGPSEIASMKLIYENSLGIYLNSDLNDNDIIIEIQKKFDKPVGLNKMVENGFLYFDKYLSRDVMLNKVNKIYVSKSEVE